MAVVRAEQGEPGSRREARAVQGTRAVQGGGERRKPSGPAGPGKPTGVAFRTAARMLGLMPREFELAEQLGEVHTITTPAGRRVAREELARLTSAEGFPEALRTRLRVVGTAEGAELLGISPGRAHPPGPRRVLRSGPVLCQPVPARGVALSGLPIWRSSPSASRTC